MECLKKSETNILFTNAIILTIIVFFGFYHWSYFSSSVDVYNFMTLDLGERPIFGLSLSQTNTHPQQNKTALGYFPGIQDGCYCRNYMFVIVSFPFNFCYDRICQGHCGKNKRRSGCFNIYEIEERSMSRWEGVSIYSEYDKDFLDYYSLLQYSVKPNQTCPKGFKKCGILDSLGQIACLPEEKSCPINYIEITSTPECSMAGKLENITTIPFTTFNYTKKYIHFSNTNIDKNIITKFRIFDSDKPCANPNEIYNPSVTAIDVHSVTECKMKVNGSFYDLEYQMIDYMNKYNLYQTNHILEQMKTNGFPETYINIMNFVDSYLFVRNYYGIKKEKFTQNYISKGWDSELDYFLNRVFDSNKGFAIFTFFLSIVTFFRLKYQNNFLKIAFVPLIIISIFSNFLNIELSMHFSFPFDFSSEIINAILDSTKKKFFFSFIGTILAFTFEVLAFIFYIIELFYRCKDNNSNSNISNNDNIQNNLLPEEADKKNN